MLEGFRNLSKTWFGKIMGVLLLIGLAGFGISNVIFQFGTNTVATAAGEDITVRDYQRAYDTQLNALAQQFGRLPTQEEAIALGVPGAVLDRLAGEAAVNKLGADLGLGISDAKLTSIVQQDPNFFGPLGTYDRDVATRVLQQNGLTEAEYRNLQTKTARRQQLISGLLAGAPASSTAVDLINRYAGDTRTVDYFVLNAQTLPPVAEPTEEDLASWLKDRQSEFRTKEMRTIDLLALSPDAIAASKTISDEEIAAEYERTKDSRVKIERRTIKQIALSTPELEKAFTDGKAAGTPIADIIASTGVTPQELGTLAQSEVTDSSLADAAFGLALNDFVIIEGIGSKRAVTVSAIEPGGQITLDEAKEDIRKQLALTQARNEYGDILDQVEELRAAFRPLKEIGERFGLNVGTVTLTPGAPELASPDLTPEEVTRISTAVFGATQGNLSPAVTLGSNRNVFFDLTKVEPERDQTLDEVRDSVAAAWTNAKTEEALDAEVKRISDQLAGGTAFADVAAGIGQFPILSQPIKRGGDGTPVFNQAVANEIFNGGPEHFGSAVNGDGDRVIFKIAEVTQAAPDAMPQAKQFVEEGVRESVYSDLLQGLKSEAGLRVNQQVMTQLMDTGTLQ